MSQVSEEHEFSAISEPDFDLDAVYVPEEGPLTFEFDIEVRPEFDVPVWGGLKSGTPGPGVYGRGRRAAPGKAA